MRSPGIFLLLLLFAPFRATALVLLHPLIPKRHVYTLVGLNLLNIMYLNIFVPPNITATKAHKTRSHSQRVSLSRRAKTVWDVRDEMLSETLVTSFCFFVSYLCEQGGEESGGLGCPTQLPPNHR